MNEADTCRKFVVPLLQKAGWDNDPHSIAEQRYFTAGRIVSQGPTARRRPGKRTDYLLRYTRDLPLAVVEAKAAYKHPADGLQQAKDYATTLGLPFAYATNGTSIVEFKQIIGRGTRVLEDYGKLTSNILDYTGTATRNFADPAFATQQEIDEHGKVIATEVITPEEPEDEGHVIRALSAPSVISEPPPTEHRKFYFDGGQVEIAAELVHELDADGKQLRVVKLTDYTAEKVRTLRTGLEDLRARWADAIKRAAIIEQLAERGIDFQTVAAQAGKPDADPFDLLCHLAFNAPVLTRRQRADSMRRQHVAFFTFYAPEAREILNDLLEKYATDGEVQFTLPDVLKVAPIWRHGNVAEICLKFGGPDELRNAVNNLQTLLYAA